MIRAWCAALLLGAALWSLPSLAAGDGEVELKLWHVYRGGEEEALNAAVDAFTRETGTRVRLLPLPYDGFGNKLSSAIPHGVGPDVFIFNHERLRSFHQQKLLAPTPLAEGTWVPTAVEALELEGQRWGYPLAFKSLALYLNEALVERTPETTDDWVALMRPLSDPATNRYGLAYESGDFYLHAPFLFGFGGELFDAAGKASFDTPGMAGSLAFVKSLQDGGLIPQEASGALVKSLFNDGRAAMVVSGPWFAGEIAKDVAYRVVPLPTVSATGLPLRPFLGVEAALVSAHSEHPEAAQALARYLSVGSASVVRAKLGRQVVASLDAYEDPQIAADPILSAFKRAAERATPMPNTLEMARVWEPMKLALRGVLQGGVSPEDAGALARRRYAALHREAPPEAAAWPYVTALIAGALFLGVVRWRRMDRSVPFRKRYPDLGKALAYVSPAVIGLAVLVGVPFVVGISLSLFHHEAGEYHFVGLANFVDILSSRGYRITEPLSFYFTLVVTVLWAAVNVALHVSIGLGLALLLKDPLLKLKGIYRVLLIVPWAVPNYITALMWKSMFHRQFGAINGLLAAMGLEPISWFTRWSTSFAANVATNTWLGFPFMMVVALGALQSIPTDLYEAADVDGASRWEKFKHITLPLLKPALLPSIILGTVWTFNMFNIIYLVSGGEPGGSTDILVSEAYRWAFQRNEQYGFAAAYSVLIFCVLFVYSKFTNRLSARAEEVLG